MTSYKDKRWGDLEADAESKYGIPSGFLSDLRLKGERSNADQVSEAGAKSVWQIIPETRNLIKKKHGVDAYASPDQAAEAAAIVVKDAFNWAKQRTKDPQEQKALAAGFYHAGGDLNNWGPRTASYVKRVTGAETPATQETTQSQGRSLKTELGAAKEQSGIAAVYAAYKSGKMTPEDGAAFEQAVSSGSIMLPRGAEIKPAGDSGVSAVVKAYSDGRMSPEDAQAFRVAVDSGQIKLPPGIKLEQPGSAASMIPVDNTQQQPQPPEPGFMDKVVGAGETALTMATGATGGMLGMVGGAARGVGEMIVHGQYGTREGGDTLERNAAMGARALTYAPRTQAGQQMTQAVGNAVSNVVPPVLPMIGQAGAITQGLKASAPIAAVAARRAAAPIVSVAQNVSQRAKSVMPSSGPGPASIGAAQVETGLLRQTKANELPIPIKQTLGQRTRNYAQQQFERETAKDVDVGAPIRERMQQQQAQMRQNLDAFVESTGAESTDLRGAGIKVNDALRSMVAQAKAKERVLYKAAEKSGEMEAPVSTAPLIKFLKENDSFNAPELSGATLGVLERELVRLGGASRVDGQLVPGQIKLKDMELVRRGVNAAIKSKQDNNTNMMTGVKAKEVIDSLTDGVGGDLYKRARTARMQRAKDFENVTLVSNLLGTKRGSTDRAIALEDVVRKAIIEPSTSLDQVKHLGGVLLKKTPQGQQAWKELQGATLQYIRDEAYKGVTRDAAGNQVISPANLNRAITNLDKTGKLDYLYGKKGAEQLRTLNEVAQDVFTAPPGAVNSSNTASALMMSLDTLATFGTTGLPVPALKVLTEARKAMKNREVRIKVNEALK
jgi:hypothetical protein